MSAIDDAIAKANANAAQPAAQPQQPQQQQQQYQAPQQQAPQQPQQQPDPNSGYWAINGAPVAPGTPGAVWTAYAPAPQQQAPAPQQTPAQYPTAPVQGAGMPAVSGPGGKMSMDDMPGGNLLVDHWLTVNEYGLILSKEKKNLFDDILVDINMTEGEGFVPKMSIKAGNPAQYWSTTDMVTSDKGISWREAVDTAKAIDPSAFEYRSADILMGLVEDISGSLGDKGKSYEAGEQIGLTLSTTNWKNFAIFHKKVKDAGLMGKTVRVKLNSEEKKNDSGNVWGVVRFTLVGEAE